MGIPSSRVSKMSVDSNWDRPGEHEETTGDKVFTFVLKLSAVGFCVVVGFDLIKWMLGIG